MEIIFIFLAALCAPILLLPVEKVFSYPFIAEEVFKMGLAWGIIAIGNQYRGIRLGWAAFIVGILFALSESILYMANFFVSGNFYQLPIRLFLTSFIHGGTTLLFYLFGRWGVWWLIPAFLLASTIHFVFNKLVFGLHV